MKSYFGHIYIPKRKEIFESESNNLNRDDFELIEGVRLCIDGDKFWIEAAIKLLGVEQFNILTGAFTSLGYVTLLECNVIAGNTGIGGYEAKLSCRYVLTGINISDPNNLKFNQLSITMPSLRKWFEKRVLNQVDIFEGHISLVKHENIHLIDFENFYLEVSFGISQNLNRETGLKISDFVILRIKAIEAKINLWDFLDIYKKFKKFLAFIGVFDKGEDTFTFFNNDVKDDNLDYLIPMNFHIKQYNFTNNGIRSFKEINYDFIEPELNTILQNWFNLTDLSDTIDLVLEQYFQSKLSSESFFLNSCFAIEIYHRRFKTNERYSKAEFRRIKKEILVSIQEEDVKKFFEEKLAHANEPSFRERLQSLKRDFQIVLPLTTDIDNLVKRIVNTRNHIVHRSVSKGLISGLELYYTAFYLETLTKLCVFRELGFSEKNILTLFSNSRNQIDSMYQLNERLQTGIDKSKS